MRSPELFFGSLKRSLLPPVDGRKLRFRGGWAGLPIYLVMILMYPASLAQAGWVDLNTQFPYIAHSRGWSAEDMERNVAYVKQSDDLHDAARALVTRAVDTARFLITHSEEEAIVGHHEPLVRAGRKASMPVRGMEKGEHADVFIEGEPLMQIRAKQELSEG